MGSLKHLENNIKNDWEQDLDDKTVKSQKNYNLDTLYEHTHSELSLQQSKRDQVITVYLALFSFLIPFSLSLASVELWMKGLIFFVVGVIGILFSFIIVRYRVYKEVYWLSCQTLTVLMNLDKEKLNKQTIQQAFFYSLKKKGSVYFETKGEKRFWNKKRFVKKNIYSSETFYHMIEVVLTSSILALSAALILGDVFSFPMLAFLGIGILVFVITFLLLMKSYFKNLIAVYAVLSYEQTDNPEKDKEAKNKMFNFAFGKAWTLHVYY